MFPVHKKKTPTKPNAKPLFVLHSSGPASHQTMRPFSIPPCVIMECASLCSYSRGKSCMRCAEPPVVATAHPWGKAEAGGTTEATWYFLQRRRKKAWTWWWVSKEALRTTKNIRPGWVGENTDQRWRLQLQAGVLEQVCGGRIAVPRSSWTKIIPSSSGAEWEAHSAGKKVTAGTSNTKWGNRVILHRWVFIFKLQYSLTLKTSRKTLIHHNFEQ